MFTAVGIGGSIKVLVCNCDGRNGSHVVIVDVSCGSIVE